MSLVTNVETNTVTRRFFRLHHPVWASGACQCRRRSRKNDIRLHGVYNGGRYPTSTRRQCDGTCHFADLAQAEWLIGALDQNYTRIDFFREGEQSCEVFDGENGILFVKKPDGRSTGDAFVQFVHESEADTALSKHKELIGTRYIELFRTTPAEVEQVLRKAQETKPRVPVQLPLVAPIPSTVPQHVITSGTKKDCIRLRGLPYEAQVEHILDFLGDNANNIVLQGVHMVYNVHGQPSGEAFIQMNSEASASQAANHCHHRYINFGKKQRYVEVFQCSGDDMNAFLTSGHVSPKATSVISPGIENNIPGMGVPFSSTLLPYYEPSPMSLMPFVQTNPFIINPFALQQPQQVAAATAASFLNKSQPKGIYPVAPSTYAWPPDDSFKPTSTAAETLVKHKTADADAIPAQPDVYSPYTAAAAAAAAAAAQPGVYFLHPNVPRVMSNPMFSKPGFPSVPGPVLFPPVTPQITPMGVLGVKRSWEQAFPLETGTVQGAKRWPTPQIATFAAPGFFPDVG
ncbi:hypothetical protein RUM43_012655 [Polyplax serrata]|uniref:RRM domain-containing protein n=1 Tax=Polyplax serrata TaxID=468196 RepID=A0AAN8P5F2_POLSC